MSVSPLAFRTTLASLCAGLLAVSCGDDGGGTADTEAASGTLNATTNPQSTGADDDAPDDDGMTGPPVTDDGDTTMTPGTDTGDGTSTGDPPLECPYEEVAGRPAVTLELVASGCDRPLQVLGHPTEPDRLLVLEQGGDIRWVEPGAGSCGAVFLHVDSQNAESQIIGGESGLLGFAFHPNFPDDPRVYVAYMPAGSPLRMTIEEYALDPGNPDQVDPGSGRILLEFCDPASNHNGGALMFDETGMLLITTGDGGPQNDGLGNGRDPGVLLGKVLRIDVEPDGEGHTPVSSNGGCTELGTTFTSYGIPADNPFLDNPSFAPEVYAWGFRNPWRAAIDPETQLLYVGDVGQGAREEVSIVRAGADLGWSDMEGINCFGAACDDTAMPGQVNADGLTMPITDYSHGEGCSVIAGSVYRSCQVPAWQGLFFYGDYCAGTLAAVFWDEDAQTAMDLGFFLDTSENLLGNGWNAYGDVFITTVDAPGQFINDGFVYRIAPG